MCGTTNDWAVYAHGEYATIEEARAAITEKFGEVRDSDANGDSFESDDEDVVEAYKPGKYAPMSSQATADCGLLNNLIRVVNRVGRGYSFEALRAKILFTEGFQKIKKPRYQRQRIPEGAMGRMPFYGVAETGPAINYGADISTLVREIEAGRL
jgi:hypothetical protein